MSSALAYQPYDEDEYEGEGRYQGNQQHSTTTKSRRNFTSFTVVDPAANQNFSDLDSYAIVEPETVETAFVEVESRPLLPTNEVKPRQWTSGTPFGVAAPSSFAKPGGETSEQAQKREWQLRAPQFYPNQTQAVPSYNSTLRPRRQRSRPAPVVQYVEPAVQQTMGEEIRQTAQMARQLAVQAYAEVMPRGNRRINAETTLPQVELPPVPGFGTFAYEFETAEPARAQLSDWLAGVTDWLNRNKKLCTFVLGGFLMVWLVMQSGFSFKGSSDNVGQVFAYGGQVASSSVASNNNAPVASAGGDALMGAPSISPQQIDAILSQYHSPATGVGQAMYTLGQKYGIDPAWALAFFIHESSAGTKGVATVTKSIGNIRVTPGYDSYAGFRKYATWEAGIEDWFKLIKDLYIDGWHLTTLQMIVPRYAPSADHNDPLAYINQVHNLVASWRGSK